MDNSQQILNFIKCFHKYKTEIIPLLKKENEIKFSCSLFKMEKLGNFNKTIDYEKLKQIIEENNPDDNKLIEFLKSKDIENIDIPKIDQIILNSYEELLTLIKNDAKIYLINYKLWNDIFDDENKINKGEFNCLIKNNIIYISFNENEKLLFKKKNNIIIIDKNTFIDDNKIKLLINFYLFNLEIKSHISTECNDCNFFTSECYLINKTWFQKYKDFFKYDKIIADLNNVNGIKNMLKEKIGKNKEAFEKLCLLIQNYCIRNQTTITIKR